MKIFAWRGSLASKLTQNVGQERSHGLVLQLQYQATTNSIQGQISFYAHHSCFFYSPARAGDLLSWGSLLKAKCLLPPPTEERTRLFGRSLALLHHNTLAMQKRTYLASIGFLVAFHFHVCEKLIHLCIQLAHSQKRKSSTPTSKRFWGPAPPLIPSCKVGSWTVLRPQLVSQLSCWGWKSLLICQMKHCIVFYMPYSI